jgi:uncharacterized Zn-binding protein involved in type VI secretion
MRRYFLKYGDRATNGAVVVEGFESDTHYGVALTFVGALMACPVCKSSGVIVEKGPRWPGLCMGKQQALSGDLCVCKCDKPSELYESQNDTYEEFTASGLEDMGCGPNGAPLLYYHDEQLTLREQRTRRALANISYRVKAGSSVIASGKTDANGRTERIRTDNTQSLVIEIAPGQ